MSVAKMFEPEADIRAAMREIGVKARAAARELANAPAERKNRALTAAARILRESASEILAANELDCADAQAKGLSPALIDRLTLNPARIEATALGLEEVSALPDPVGRVLARYTRPNGLIIERVATPLGVVGVIYESRPNVTADAGALCLKSGNAVVLRGGSDSFRSSAAIHGCLVLGLREAGLPEAAISRAPFAAREAVGEMLKGLGGALDVIVPRGGKSLVERVQREARVPVFAHLEGVVHVYVDRAADFDKALKILVNAKMRRTGVCGAAETLLVHRAVAPFLLSPLIDALIKAGCAVRGDAAAREAEFQGDGGERRGLEHGISRRDHHGWRRRQSGRGDQPYRDLWLASHGLHRDRGQGGGGALPQGSRFGDCHAQRLDPVRRRGRVRLRGRDRHRHRADARARAGWGRAALHLQIPGAGRRAAAALKFPPTAV